MIVGAGTRDRTLREDEVRALLAEGLGQAQLAGKRVLVIIPDSTRTAPVPLFFRLFHELLHKHVAALDYLVALGTHPPMDETALNRLVGVTTEERTGRYADVRIFNHRWDLPEAFVTLGVIPQAEINELTGGRFALNVPVTVNRMILDYDQIIICGPVFPHEVAGFSGGHKYFFPGISGPEVINTSHWLGALITNMVIIGTKDTPTRRLIDRAASFIATPTLCCAFVVEGMELGGLYIGSPQEAWSHAADLAAQLHVVYMDHPFQRVLSVMPDLYDDLWTASKGMYKLEPVVADGGEIIIYAPRITEVSYTHGPVLDVCGYHVRDYFLKQWDHYCGYPWGVLAHATLVRGAGTYDPTTGVETPRVRVTLATGIPRERCERIGLGYLDPAGIDPEEWADREDDGILLVRRAGEMLYRLKHA
ncbi:MAG: DUF2088 domain-containing protein [Anaerolineales bacterium]|nr:DUF2088 domain-containing protein [Anaerolineales bacterium]